MAQTLGGVAGGSSARLGLQFEVNGLRKLNHAIGSAIESKTTAPVRAMSASRSSNAI
jgi:hypothetical protein